MVTATENRRFLGLNMLSLWDVLLLALTFCGVAFWWSDRGVKQKALQYCQQRCQKLDVQMLDQSIQVVSMSLKRNKRGHLTLKREFNFEFSTVGDRRYLGKAFFLGHQLVSIDMEPHRIDSTEMP